MLSGVKTGRLEGTFDIEMIGMGLTDLRLNNLKTNGSRCLKLAPAKWGDALAGIDEEHCACGSVGDSRRVECSILKVPGTCCPSDSGACFDSRVWLIAWSK